MEIVYHKTFVKHYRKRIVPFHQLDQAFQTRLKVFIDQPEHPLLKDHKLVGKKSSFRAFSVTGDIRVVYRQEQNCLVLYDIGSHAQVY